MNENDLIQNEIKGHHIVVFMKGSLDKPRCCLSTKETLVLKKSNCKTVDVLQKREMYDALRRYTNFTHFPQVFVDGRFVGTKLQHP